MFNLLQKIIPLLFLPIILAAQYENIKFEHLTVEDGLSSSRTNSILQDSKGFIWIATYDGLNKYDGYTFTTFRYDPADSNSLSSNNVIYIYEDHNTNLWLTTLGGGLNKFDTKTEKFKCYKWNPDDSTSISSNNLQQVRGYKYSNRDVLWIGGANGLNRFDIATEQITRYPIPGESPPENNIEGMLVDPSGYVWVGCLKGGFYKFNPASEQFTHYAPSPGNPDGLSGGSVSWIFLDNAGMLWIGTRDGGLNKFNPQTEKFTRYMHDPKDPASLSSNYVLTILEDRASTLWIGTADGGLNKFDKEKEKFIRYQHDPGDPFSIGGKTAIALLEDKSGVLWVGTWRGVSKTNPGKAQFYDIRHIPGNPNSLSGNYILVICESEFGGNLALWAGTKADGLNRIDRATGIITRYHHDPANPNSISNNNVSALFEDNKGVLWIGTYGSGLIKYDPKTKQFSHFQNNPADKYSLSGNIVRCILEDKSGRLWIGTMTAGLNKFDRKTGKFTLQGDKKGVQWIIEDHSGVLWYGGFSGLKKLNCETSEYLEYWHDPDDPHSISNNTVNVIYESSFRGKNVMWVGTEAGLNRFDPESEKFFRYTTKEGLPSDMINGILEDKHDNLWLSTNSGLSRFNPQTKEIKNYDVNDGLLSNQFYPGAFFKGRDGALFFGGINGINYFYPERIKDNTQIPEIVITGFRIFNQPVMIKRNVVMENGDAISLSKNISATQEIVLSYSENIFSFEFAALDYRSPLKNKYAYQMEDVDPDWVYTDASRRFATYTNLDPGEYIFRVKGSNNDAIWNEAGTSIKIIITPPWWETNLAYFMYLFLIGAIVFAVWRVQINRLKMKHQMEMDHLQTGKLQEVDRMKSRFFANISHEFRTPLTLIKGPVKQMLDGKFMGNLKDQHKMILRNSDRLLGLINQILDLSKLESGEIKLKVVEIDIVHYMKSIVLSFSSLAESKKVILKFSSPENSIIVYIDRDKLEKIITNLLSNAFKFTPVGGEIKVALKNPNKSQIKNYKLPITNYQLPIPNSNCIEIKISNTGPGISKDQLERIFDRFYQSDNNYKKDSDGTGIGLALTKELVELHHGTISVTSIPGEPTTFTVKLPITKESFKDDEVVHDVYVKAKHSGQESITEPENLGWYASPIQSADLHTRSSGKSVPLVLIVEDNPDVTNYISSFMENDYRILTAEDGIEGLKKSIDKYPDLIISDVMMPEMDGFELCQKIKTDERISHIPIILLTAKADIESKIDGLEFGADDYVTKPFESRELQIRSKNLIEQRRKLREKFSLLIDLKPGDISASSMDEQFLQRLLSIFEDHIEEPEFSTEDLAREIGMSRMHLNRKIQALTNLSTNAFIRTLRLQRAARILSNASETVSEVAYKVGFNNLSYFSKAFRRHFGKLPSEFTKKQI
jgi:signal transduction histidine kinase/ligand-binding sensor domain-containing protein/DNA-binding response OmpR family regulator